MVGKGTQEEGSHNQKQQQSTPISSSGGPPNSGNHVYKGHRESDMLVVERRPKWDYQIRVKSLIN